MSRLLCILSPPPPRSAALGDYIVFGSVCPSVRQSSRLSHSSLHFLIDCLDILHICSMVTNKDRHCILARFSQGQWPSWTLQFFAMPKHLNELFNTLKPELIAQIFYIQVVKVLTRIGAVNEQGLPKDSGSAGHQQMFAMPELLSLLVNTFRSRFLGQSLKYFTNRQCVY